MFFQLATTMDLTNNNNNNSTSVKNNPDPETDSPAPTRIHLPSKPSPPAPPSFNGVLKRHAPPHHHPVVVSYRECLKNHAAALGGHAVDGCGEFMAAPAADPSDPTSLRCAACGCHRNFHRRDPDDPPPPPPAAAALEYRPLHRHHPPPPPSGGATPEDSPSPPPISSSYYHHHAPPPPPHVLLSLAGHHHLSNPNPNPNPNSNSGGSSGRKRFRTKFTHNQKEKMLELAERVDWKMQKRDEDLINRFCGEIGVEKGVFKVWMHNNKNTFGKNKEMSTHFANDRIATSTPPPANGARYNNSECKEENVDDTNNINGFSSS